MICEQVFFFFAEICITEMNTALLALFICIRHLQHATHGVQGEVRETKTMLWEITQALQRSFLKCTLQY